METEVSSPRSGRRSKPASRSSSIGSAGGSVEYTGLRDVLVEGGGEHHGHGHHQHRGGSWREFSCHDNIHEFDASSIGIRNQLLKHAASAYLQSAVVVAGGARDQGCCLGRLCCGCSGALARLRCGGRGHWRGRVLMRASSRQGCVDDPADLCAASPPSSPASGPS